MSRQNVWFEFEACAASPASLQEEPTLLIQAADTEQDSLLNLTSSPYFPASKVFKLWKLVLYLRPTLSWCIFPLVFLLKEQMYDSRFTQNLVVLLPGCRQAGFYIIKPLLGVKCACNVHVISITFIFTWQQVWDLHWAIARCHVTTVTENGQKDFKVFLCCTLSPLDGAIFSHIGPLRQMDFRG